MHRARPLLPLLLAVSVSVPAPLAAGEPDREERAWTVELAGHLNRFKRYPPQARDTGLSGEVELVFLMDAGGAVVKRRVDVSSGHAVLDAAALEMLDRAQPLPAAPGMGGEALRTLRLPVHFDSGADQER